jgi:lipopolysaccharide biosynthesis protein
MKIAVCVHLYHYDMWETIKNYLNNLKFDYKLVVNLPLKNEDGIPLDFDWEFYVNYYLDLKKAGKDNYTRAVLHYLKHGEREGRVFSKTNKDIVEKIKEYKQDSKILISPNKGMDVGGFLYTYKFLNNEFDLLLKIHTKKGVGHKNNQSMVSRRLGINEAEKIGSIWFNSLMSGVLNNEQQVNKIINTFKNNPKCGMVGFNQYNNFHKNINIMNDILPRIGIPKHLEQTRFVGGTIFWISNEVLKPYLNEKNLEYLFSLLPYGYVHEPSVNHAMERIFGSFVYNENKELMVIN